MQNIAVKLCLHGSPSVDSRRLVKSSVKHVLLRRNPGATGKTFAEKKRKQAVLRFCCKVQRCFKTLGKACVIVLPC